jgi:hypothetical protein
MDIYPKNKTQTLDLNLFQNPTAEYRGAPFWSWNCKLDEGQLLRQLDILKAMGMGGAHIHSRTGMATEYLGDDFMSLVRRCAEKARAEGMLVWLYDEDRWPSGFAGGLVTQDHRFRQKHLLFTCHPYDNTRREPVIISSVQTSRTENGVLLARYHVLLENGVLKHYRRLRDGEAAPAGGRVWCAYLETALESPWFNNQTYVDTLDKAAIERFIQVTHERYKQVVGSYFGSVIPAIFTDEPQFAREQTFAYADSTDDVVIPFTADFFETYRQTYGDSLEESLPELFWELPDGKPSLTRYRYHDHLAERFAQAFGDTIGNWCSANGLALTGHMMEEPTLQSQTESVGEVMRALRGFGLPGIDMLCDWREYTTAKQAQSISHQYGRSGVLSELYGVTNWDFDFVGHKAQGDWQAALGITVRVQHLAWVSMEGEAKRDYPASISYQSPWYQEYPLIENHFARLNTVLTRGKAAVRVGVIHPVESYWLAFGPREQTQMERAERDAAFINLTDWLLFGLIDFDFISEALLPSLTAAEPTAPLKVGESAYDVIVVPNLRTIRSTTLERLESFRAAGGTVIFAGEIPSLVDVRPSARAQEFAGRCQCTGYAQTRILSALAPFRTLSATLQDGSPADSLLHQIRADGSNRYIFLCNTDKIEGRQQVQIRIKGQWQITLMDTLTGKVEPLASAYTGDDTLVTWDFPPHGSLLLALEPGKRAAAPARPTAAGSKGAPVELADPVPVTLSEPNVLLLDMASCRLDDEAWQPTEEILRLDNGLRQRLGYPLRMRALAQPWIDKQPPTFPHTLSLRFTITSAIDVAQPLLAVEQAHAMRFTLDGQKIEPPINGWWVDESIQTAHLPALKAGTHELVITMPYGPHSNPEWCYLLGDFGVEVAGRHARLAAPVRSLAFGDWTKQGLPFYAGNVTYHCPIAGRDQAVLLHVPKFKAPLLSVTLDETIVGRIALAPFELPLGMLPAGPHRLSITAFGNRVNAFGSVHNADERWTWFGPNAWRTEGDAWAYEYQLKPMGLLTAPNLR